MEAPASVVIIIIHPNRKVIFVILVSHEMCKVHQKNNNNVGRSVRPKWCDNFEAT